MGTRFQRHLGVIGTMDPGQWTSEPLRQRVSGAVTVYVTCPKCGGVHEIATSRIARDGGVVPAWSCEGAVCSFKDFIALESWGEPSFDLSDEREPS